MNETSPPRDGLALLAEAFRARRSGLLVIGEEPGALRVQLDGGQIVAMGPPPAEGKLATPMPKPGDSVRLRLERVLSEIGMRHAPASDALKEVDPEAFPASLRDRLIARLAEASPYVFFEESAAQDRDLVAVVVATEPLILEAVRQVRKDEAVRAALGDLDRPLVAISTFADERTLTLTEGYLLSRIDGTASARQVLEMVPLDPAEVERTLLGLMLTGRVQTRSAPAAAPPGPDATTAAAAAPEDAATSEPEPIVVEHEPRADIEVEAIPDDEEAVAEAIPDDEEAVAEGIDDPRAERAGQRAGARPVRTAATDAAMVERRRDIVEMFQGLPLKQNHFQVLGVEPGSADEAVKRAYVTLTKRYHPDANRDERLNDLHDMLEAIIIRVGEAWEVIGEAKSRASYEARAGIVRRPRPPRAAPPEAAPGGATPPAAAAAPDAEPPADTNPSPYEGGEYVPPEEILFRARLLVKQARLWDAIQLLESALPAMEPRSLQHRGRLLLARAYSKNPHWLRRAEETLQELMREDPTNADAYYELGLVYKTGGFAARAQAMFKRALELRPGHKEAATELGVPQEDAGASGTGGAAGLFKKLFGKGKAS
jgi:curved DNA-binding protein CbpA